jgi:hypothetical protein
MKKPHLDIWALKKRPLYFALFLLLSPLLPAQNPSRSGSPYLLPQTIFVGDSGRLVVPLGRAFAEVDPFAWENSENLPKTPDLFIKRIELERRGDASRLLIDFIPYAPGILALPPLEFSSLGAALPTLSGLEVQIASILDPSQMFLSEPAPPLAVPGTSFLIYGTLALVIALFFLGIPLSIWIRNHSGEFWLRFRRRRLLGGMGKFLRRLTQECNIDKSADPAFCLSRLSGELREFLSLFTGVNCRSLTAGEFLVSSTHPALPPARLSGLFRSWDTLRFSGQGMKMEDLFRALGETEKLISELDKAEREVPLLEKEAV